MKIGLLAAALAMAVPSLATNDVTAFSLTSGSSTPMGGAGSTGLATASIHVSALNGINVKFFSSDPSLVRIDGITASAVAPCVHHADRGQTTQAVALSYPNTVLVPTPVVISAQRGTNTPYTFTVVVQPAPSVNSVSVSRASDRICGGGGLSMTGTVTLNSAAPAGGANVTVSSSDASLLTVDGWSSATLIVPEGSSSATFAIAAPSSPASASSVTLSASTTGHPEIVGSHNVTVAPLLTSMTLANWKVPGSKSITGCVLSEEAPAGDVTVNLSSSDPAATPAATVTLHGGATTSDKFTINTTGVAADVNTTITGTVGANSVSASLEVDRPHVRSVSTDITNGTVGDTITGTVTLNVPAVVDVNVQLVSFLPSCTVPAQITIPAGQTTGTFPVTLLAISNATPQTGRITADSDNSSTQSCQITNNAPYQVVLDSATITSGNPFGGTVTLFRAAGPSGVSISISANNAWATLTSGSTVNIAPGATTGVFYGTTTHQTTKHTTRFTLVGLSLTTSVVLSLNP